VREGTTLKPTISYRGRGRFLTGESSPPQCWLTGTLVRPDAQLDLSLPVPRVRPDRPPRGNHPGDLGAVTARRDADRMRVTRLCARGLFSFGDEAFSLQLGQANLSVVVGPNASGKSSLGAVVDLIVAAVAWSSSVNRVSRTVLHQNPLSDPPPRRRDARSRRRQRPRLPPSHHRQADRPNRRNMEPLRPWRPLTVTIGPGSAGN